MLGTLWRGFGKGEREGQWESLVMEFGLWSLPRSVAARSERSDRPSAANGEKCRVEFAGKSIHNIEHFCTEVKNIAHVFNVNLIDKVTCKQK